jgi:hypothetical protein
MYAENVGRREKREFLEVACLPPQYRLWQGHRETDGERAHGGYLAPARHHQFACRFSRGITVRMISLESAE